jgi:DegV family protein with EDD domain
VTISSKLTRLYNSTLTAKELAVTELPGVTIEVIDSNQATSSEGMIVLSGARAAAEGKGLPEVKLAAELVRKKVHALAFLDTIEHVYRSGRIPKFASQVGSKLNIKPILAVHDTVHFATMVRSRKKGTEKMLEMMREKVDGQPIHAAVTHAYAPEEAVMLKERIQKEFNCLEIWLSEFSPVMGYACGTGTVGVSFYTE